MLFLPSLHPDAWQAFERFEAEKRDAEIARSYAKRVEAVEDQEATFV